MLRKTITMKILIRKIFISMKKIFNQNVAITVLIFGAMIGVGVYIYKKHKKGIEEDIDKNWG
jgi:predicted transporter